MTNTSRHEFVIDAPGLPVKLQPRAEADIRKLVEAIASKAERSGSRFLLERLLVTSSYEEEVNRIRRGRLDVAKYVAVRSSVHAIGSTLWTRLQQGDIKFAVVVDATQIGAWSLNNPTCLVTVLHELFHVILESDQLGKLGGEAYTAPSDTKELILYRWADNILDEFDVDREVDGIVRLLTKDDGNRWSLREFEESMGVDWSRSLLNSLDRMPKLIDEKIGLYRTRQIELDDLAAEVFPQMRDLLILLCHTAAIYEGTASWSKTLRYIRETESAQRFLKEHLDTILGQLDNNDATIASSVAIIADAIDGILRNCGLSLATVEQGLYIGVDAPSR